MNKLKHATNTLLMFFLLSILMLAGCSKSDQDMAEIKIEIPPVTTNAFLAKSIIVSDTQMLGADSYVPYAPADISGFDCIFVNVIGSGIGDWEANSSRVSNGSKFGYVGTFSKLIPVAIGGTVEVKVKKGTKRYVQLLGVKSNVGCPANTTSADLNSIAKFPGIFLISNLQQDVMKDASLTLRNNYSAATATDLRGSESQPIPGNVDSTPPTVTNGTLTASASDASSITVSWSAATDAATLSSQLKYKLIKAASGTDLSTIVKAESAGTIAMDWTAGTTSKAVTGLSASTNYEFVVLAKDYMDNKSIYTQTQLSTTAGGGGATTFTVTYNANTGTGAAPVDSSSPYSSGANVTLMNSSGISKVGYTFDGWYLSADTSGTKYSPGDVYSNITANVIFYAKWLTDPTTYRVSYNANGGAGSAPTDSTDYANGEMVTVSGQNTLSRTGYLFNGWNTSADGSGTSFTSGNSFNISANTTLYALWARIVHVSNDLGNDSNDGSEISPFKTIAHALSTFSANEGGEIRVAKTGTSYSISSTINLKNSIRLRGGYTAGEPWTQHLADASTITTTATAAFTYFDVSSLSGNQLIEGFVIDNPTAHSADVIGINISASPSTTIRYNTISIDSTTGAYPIKVSGTTRSEINGNFIRQTKYASNATTVAGVYYTALGNGSAFKIFNNIIDVGYIVGGGGVLPGGIEIKNSPSVTLTAYVRNNTIRSSTKNGTRTFGFGVNNSSGVTFNLYFDNNIIFSPDASGSKNPNAVDCAVVCVIQSMKNNNFFAVDDFLNQANNSSYGTVATLEAGVTNASGNISTEMVNAGYFTSAATNNYRLSDTAPASITTGGLDGFSLSWGMTNDADGVTRTGGAGTGWSRGAYEK